MSTATTVFDRMVQDAKTSGITRRVTDRTSPMQKQVLEAPFGTTYVITEVSHNVVRSKSIDLKWATANTLHFFAGTEEAGVLRQYNEHADRFLTGDRWIGAYGAIAMPQIRDCCKLLRSDPQSRRAVVSMGGYNPEECDINRPACWNMLHFMANGSKLDMLVYQRSLNIVNVMPYDAIVLTNVLIYVALETHMDIGSLYWTVGSAHMPNVSYAAASNPVQNLYVPAATLQPSMCMDMLKQPEVYYYDFLRYLQVEGPYRT